MPREDEIRPNSDFSALLRAFNDAGVDYLLIGGRAYSFYDQPRYTKDYDIWIRSTPENAERAFRALVRFAAPLDGVTANDLMDPESYYAMGIPPNRIDVLNTIEGIAFDDACASTRRRTTRYGTDGERIAPPNAPAAEVGSLRWRSLRDAPA